MQGKIKIGYIFDSLILLDGTVFDGLTTKELIATLTEHGEEEGRKMKMKMGLPDSTEIALPEGDVGAKVEMVNGQPVITKIGTRSSLKKSLRVGLVVDKVVLEDGTTASGMDAEEIMTLLADDNGSGGRRLSLVNPTKKGMSQRGMVYPKEKIVDLPTGKLGTSFKGSKLAKVSKLKDDSPMRGLFRVGMYIDSLMLPDGTEFRGLGAVDLGEALKASAEAEGRKILLKSPTSKTLPTGPSTKVYLPDLGTAEEMGLFFAGMPAVVKEVEDSSPLYGKIRRGMIVLACGTGDGTEYEEVEDDEIYDALEESSGNKGRFLTLKNMPVPLPDERVVPLPPGKLGIVFRGTPPSVTKMNPESPLIGKAMIGMSVDTLTLENGEILYDMDTHELVDVLGEHKSSEGRVIRFINPATMEFTSPKDLPLPDEQTVLLPAGKLGVVFKGGPPCKVTQVNKSSPLKREVRAGMAVDTLTIGSTTYMDMTAKELVATLTATADSEERELVLKNPDADVEFSKMPDSKECVLPPGKLGVVFKGTPPMATKFKEGSPMAGQIPVGMYVDMLTLEDGTVLTGLSATELVSTLGESSMEEDRTLLFKNPKTTEPSPVGCILPDEKTIELPTGKLGVSFKGKGFAKATRIHDDSPVRGLVRVGMVIDQLEIPTPDGNMKTFAGMTAKEAVRILVDSADIEGRLMTLKNPDTAEMTKRNVMVDDMDGSVLTSSDDASEDISQRG